MKIRGVPQRKFYEVTLPNGCKWYRQVDGRQYPLRYVVVVSLEQEYGIYHWSRYEHTAKKVAHQIARRRPYWTVEILPVTVIEADYDLITGSEDEE